MKKKLQFLPKEGSDDDRGGSEWRRNRRGSSGGGQPVTVSLLLSFGRGFLKGMYRRTMISIGSSLLLPMPLVIGRVCL
uniref:Uncharacterized protein n=1 Tax=Cucumis melo TaxID=3656 RepID=A0A9I9E8F5_CUCME